MKLFKYAASLAALAMLGACSSEDPEMPVTSENYDGPTSLISIKIDQSGITRATDPNEIAEMGESNIKDVQLIITDLAGTNEYVNDIAEFKTTDSDIDGSVAYFEVPSVNFEMMKSRQELGQKFLIYAYVNGKANKAAKLDLTTLTTGSIPSDRKFAEKDQFLMSNAQKYEVKLHAPGTATGKDKASAWMITGSAEGEASTIEVARIAARFDYKPKKDGQTVNEEYTALSDDDIKITIDGMSVNTLASTAFILPQWNSDGKPTTTYHAFQKDEKEYAVTTDVTVTSLATYDGHIYDLTSAKAYVYGRPNSFHSDQDGVYTKAAYVAIKAHFTSTKYAEAMAAKQDIYALGGVVLGTFEDIKSYQKDGKGAYNPTIPDDLTADQKTVIETVKNKVNEYLDIANFTVTETNTEANIKKKLNDVLSPLVYKAAADGNYYTYYAKRIVDNPDATNDAKKYVIYRNHVYSISVASISFLGLTGDEYKPGDKEIVSSGEKLLIDVTMEVSKWVTNNKNENLKL
ncbi:MAG: fimbria major subunit [Muribaculaceae bacterium]|nr:fimbria major subunit [Muribaculaceae bacterium]